MRALPFLLTALLAAGSLAACDDTTKTAGGAVHPPSPEPGPPKPDDAPVDGGAEQPSSEPVPPSPEPAVQPSEPSAPSGASFPHNPAGSLPTGQGAGYLDRTVWSPTMCWPLAEAGSPIPRSMARAAAWVRPASPANAIR